MSDPIVELMLALALAQEDPAEREAMLAIMRADGWMED